MSSSSAPAQTDQAAAFAADPRVHFNKASNKWEYEDEQGKEFEWNEVANGWMPILDEETIKAQQAAYSVQGVDENAPAAPVLARDKKRKDKPEVDYTSNTASTSTLPATARATSKPKRAKPNPSDPSSSSSVSSSAAQPAKPPRKSTAVYITNLPLDTTREELASVFSKCGIILLTPQNTPKINMYTDEATGMFKGEALVMYYKETSVELAITVLDETELRLGSTGEGKMKVRRAEWGDNSGGGGEKKEGEEGGAAADGGEGGGKKPEKKRMTEEEKKELNRRMKRMENKLTDWDSSSDTSDTETSHRPAPPPPANARLVVLKHMFTLEELEEDATLLIDLKEEVREEAEGLGEVTSVTIFDKEEEGVMTVKFKDPIAARACVLKFNNRFFAQRRIAAFLHDNRTKYKRSGAGDGVEDEAELEKEEKARLAKFEEFLLQDSEGS